MWYFCLLKLFRCVLNYNLKLFLGDHLQNRYDSATFVKPTKRGRLKVKKDSGTIPTANDLVFLKKSPDYCHANPTIGSLGNILKGHS